MKIKIGKNIEKLNTKPKINNNMLNCLKNLFTEHPNSVNETYFQHMFYAFRCGSKLICSGLCCLVHGFFPFSFKTVASDTIINMYEHIKLRNPKCRTNDHGE